jgi:anti-sigma regulatory factor (Ser/Thr protein kinase)
MEIETAQGVVPRDHVVQFYERDVDLIASVSNFLVDGLLIGEVAIVVATPEHAEAFDAALRAAGVDVEAARMRGDLICADADQTLSQTLVGGWPDPEALAAGAVDLVRRATESGRRVRLFGEMVALLWDSGRVAEAIELEDLWGEIGRELPLFLYCAYRAQSVVDDDHAASLRHLCHLHSAVVGDPAAAACSTAAGVVAHAEDARSFPCDPRSSGVARRFVADRLIAWGREAFVDDASIVVAELVTNAVLHAESEFIVALSFHGDSVRVSVRDASSALPAIQAPTPQSVSGRGLVLISAVAQRWGTELLADGKVVWAELAAR